MAASNPGREQAVHSEVFRGAAGQRRIAGERAANRAGTSIRFIELPYTPGGYVSAHPAGSMRQVWPRRRISFQPEESAAAMRWATAVS